MKRACAAVEVPVPESYNRLVAKNRSRDLTDRGIYFFYWGIEFESNMDMPLSNFSISADAPMLPHSAKSPSRILPLWFTADHGGHDRTHGTGSPEDMTIPFIIKGKNFKVGEKP